MATSSTVDNHLVRDRVTWLHYAQQGALGYFQFGFGPSVLLFREESGVSNTVAGLYGPAQAVGAVVGGVLFPHLTRRMSLGSVLAIGLTGIAAGVAMFCLAPTVTGTLVAASVTMMFGILVLSGVSTGLSTHHGATGGAAMSESNAASAGMGFVAPLLLNLAVEAGLGWRMAMGVAIVFAGVMAVVTVVASRGRQVSVATQAVHGRLPRRYWLAWGCLLAAMSVEMTLLLWIPVQLRAQTGLSAEDAAIGISAVLGGMIAGRLAGGRVATRVPLVPLMFATLAVAGAGFFVFWSATTASVAIGGLVLCGIGVALHFPLGVAITMQASDNQPELAMSRNSYAAALSFGVVPSLCGALADLVGIKWAFGLVPACLLIATVTLAQLVRVSPVSAASTTAPRVRTLEHA
jgi:MFS family permease